MSNELRLLQPVGPACFTEIGIGAEVFYREQLLNRYWWLNRGTGRVVGCPNSQPFCISDMVLVEWEDEPGVYRPTLKSELETF